AAVPGVRGALGGHCARTTSTPTSRTRRTASFEASSRSPRRRRESTALIGVRAGCGGDLGAATCSQERPSNSAGDRGQERRHGSFVYRQPESSMTPLPQEALSKCPTTTQSIAIFK